MLRLVVFVAAVAAATHCPTVAASGAAQPIALALQRADMPGTPRKAPLASPSPAALGRSALSPFGIPGLQGAGYAYTWAAGGAVETAIGPIEKEWHLEGSVYRAPDAAGAKRLFALGKAAQTGFFSDFPTEPRFLARLALPRYGEEQTALVSTDPRFGVQAMVFVRKGSVVWELRVGPIPLQFKPAKERVVAVLRTYAAKQERRVGAG
jgi:hypothetical protein